LSKDKGYDKRYDYIDIIGMMGDEAMSAYNSVKSTEDAKKKEVDTNRTEF